MSKAIKVLVVDDSAFSRQTIKKMLESDPRIEVVGVAADGMDAMAKTLRLKPDLITLDFEMPEMDGFSFLRWLMQQRPTPVIMVSSHSDRKTVFQALELGAVDFIVKPSRRASVELMGIEKDLLAKVRGIEDLNMDALSKNLKRFDRKEKVIPGAGPLLPDAEMVAIGASTGGPPALQMVLSGLPGDFPAAIVISQHMPKGFTRSLADRLDRLIRLRVKEADERDEVEKGQVLICPGGYHMSFEKRGRKVRVALNEAVFEDKYVPSIDTMLSSAASVYGQNMIGIVLTGMGNDGKKGLTDVKAKGGYTIAESEETAVVYGMPAEAVKAGAALTSLPIYNISGEMIRQIMGDRRS